MSAEIITRNQARSLGLSKYFTGEPCRNGHTAERYTQSGTCEECIRQSKAMMISRPAPLAVEGEVVVAVPSERLEIQRTKLQIEQAKITLRAQALALKTQREQRATIEKVERIERRQRADTVKNKLTTVIIVSDPLDYASNFLMIWAFAAQRNPLLKQEDLKGREFGDNRYQFKCFPEDKQAILDATNNVWNRRQAATLLPEIEQKRLAAQAALQAMVDAEDNGEPEGDPT